MYWGNNNKKMGHHAVQYKKNCIGEITIKKKKE